MTRVRKMMLEELQRRNYSQTTDTAYINARRVICRLLRLLPDQLGRSTSGISGVHDATSASSRPIPSRPVPPRCDFLYIQTLKRPHMLEYIPIPKTPAKLPRILSREEIARLIDGASNLMHRAMLMTVYSTGMRRPEMCSLKASDVDSDRNVIHIRKAKAAETVTYR